MTDPKIGPEDALDELEQRHELMPPSDPTARETDPAPPIPPVDRVTPRTRVEDNVSPEIRALFEVFSLRFAALDEKVDRMAATFGTQLKDLCEALLGKAATVSSRKQPGIGQHFHDINTELTVIKGSAQILVAEHRGDEELEIEPLIVRIERIAKRETAEVKTENRELANKLLSIVQNELRAEVSARVASDAGLDNRVGDVEEDQRSLRADLGRPR